MWAPARPSLAAVLGGAAGGLLAASSTSGRPIEYTLDLLTGDITTLTDDERTAPPDTVRLHLYCRKSSLGPRPEPVYLNGALVGQLAENQALTLPYTDHLSEVRLCLGTRKDWELVLRPDFLAPLYIKVSRYPDDDTLPALEVVSAKAGAADEQALANAKPAK